ncbi:hypothetical protein [Candidatus Albibeggiatoa sp. nov. NOAA]|uniref:hypothetical protein n=1 Tax=Candidatus Albibeggiatoa sp. nov. NOAA TaxID=3162724 RepID=UPI0032FA36C5|nr:hypothetical protein [Thiotrichaceae bacterium]
MKTHKKLRQQESDLRDKNLDDWLQENALQISTYKSQFPINHITLNKVHIIDNIIAAIKKSDVNAIELGCNLVTQNKHIPFGRTLKYNILHTLKNQHQYINSAYREKLSKLAVAYLNANYPPKDIKPLCKLIKRFEAKYAQYVIEKIHQQTDVTVRWAVYLKSS